MTQSAAQPERRSGWRFLAAWLIGRVAAWLAIRAAAGPICVMIDPGSTFERLRLAQLWAQAPVICPDGRISWLPLPFYLQGALLRIAPDPFLLPGILNAALSLTIVVLVYLVARELFDETSALTASFIAAFSATAVMEGLEPSADCLFQAALLAGLFFWMRHASGGRPRSLWAAACFLTLAAMTRFEGWAVLAVFAVYAALRANRPGPAALVCAFPAAWMLYGGRSSSDSLAFAHETLSMGFYGNAPLHGIVWRYAQLAGTFLHSEQSVVPILAALALPQAARDERLRWYLAGSAVVALFFLVSNAHMYAWVGLHVWALQLWLMPLAGAGAAALGEVRRPFIAAAAILFALSAAATERNYIEGAPAVDRPSLVRTFLEIRDLEKTALGPQDRVLIQLPVGRDGPGRDRLLRLAAPPGVVIYDRRLVAKWDNGEGQRRILDESGNPSVLDQASDVVDRWLRDRGVRLVVTSRPTRLPASWKNVGSIEERSLWLRSNDALGRAD